MTTEAIITPIKNLRKHPNADRLQIGTAYGSQVIVSLDTIEDTLGIFIPDDMQLSHEFCAANNLYSHKELNSDPTKGGFFGNNRRVRAQKFRGEISDGFWVELHTLAFAGNDASSLKEGTTLTEFNGVPICNKYFTPATMKSMGGKGSGKTSKKGFKPSEFPYFKEHWDTQQLLQNIKKIRTGAIISISEKCHGCVSADTIVETLEYGLIEIQELVHNRTSAHIKAFDTKANSIVYAPIDDWYLKENHGIWYRITLENGETLEITGNNPVWLPNQKCYRRIDELAENDILLVD
jgi:hypothetical protein